MTCTDDARFRELLGALAADPAGWQSPAGSAVLEFLGGVLERKRAAIAATVGDAGVMLAPEDVVSEAVLVVSGDGLAENVPALLALDSPLGYVVAAVSRNVDRLGLEDQMGVGSRQVEPGTRAIAHLPGVARGASEGVEGEDLDLLGVEPAWARGREATSVEAKALVRSFAQVMIARFHVRARVVAAGLEVAADVAVEGERAKLLDPAVPMTAARTRRRLARFREEAGALRRVGLDRGQVQAMSGLVFGTERHPEWSLLAECGRAAREDRAVVVTGWQASQARLVAARPGTRARVAGRGVAPSLQPSLFDAPGPGRLVVRSA
jgi:hypothetical protein